MLLGAEWALWPCRHRGCGKAVNKGIGYYTEGSRRRAKAAEAAFVAKLPEVPGPCSGVTARAAGSAATAAAPAGKSGV